MAETTLQLGADLSKLRRELAKLPNMTEKAAQQALIALEKQVNKAEKAAKAANARLKKSGKDTVGSLRGVEEAAGDADAAIKGVGGAVGLFVPELEDAAIVVAEMGAGIEGMIRMGRAALPVLGAMALAAAAAGAAYKVWSERTERLKANTAAVAAATGHHRTMVDKIRSAREDLLVTLGKVSEKEREIMAVRRAALIEASPRLQELTTQITAQQLAVDKSKRSYDAAAASAAAAADSGDMVAGATARGSQQLQASAKSRAKSLKKERHELEKLEGQRAQAIADMGELIAVGIQDIEMTDKATKAAAAAAAAISDQREERSRLITLINAQRDLEGQLGAASIAAAQAQAGALTSVDAALADQEMAILRAQATYDEAAAARVQAMAREEALMRNLGTASDALAQREKAIQAEYERKLSLIAQMEEAGVSLEEREAKASAVELEREQQIATIRQENERIHLAMIEARSEAERLAMEDAARAAEEMRERMREVMGMATASVAALGGLAAENSQASEQRAEESAARHEDILTALDEAQTELTTASSTRERDAAEAKIAILQEQAAAEKERQRQAEQAAERAARVARALSMMQIIGSTASAITKEMEKGFPAAIPGMALAAITGGAQLAKAAAQPTSFDVGGIIGRGGMVTSAPDQVPIRALPGEAVLNRSAVSALGERGVERLNRGDSGGGLTVVPVPTYRHFDRFYSAEVRRGGSLSRSIRGSRRIGQREV